MSFKTIYRCDKCGGEQETDDQFWSVGVIAVHGAVDLANYSTMARVVGSKAMQVCHACLEKLGIHCTIQPEEKDYIPPPSLEDLICEIVRREIDS